MTAADFASDAASRLASLESYALEAPVTISGAVAEIILDAPPETYLSFGPSPSDPTLFAIMDQPFARDMEYNKPGFFDDARTAAVRCSGEVTMGAGGAGPPLVSGCKPVFR